MHGSSNITPVPSDRDGFATLGRPAVLYQGGDGTVVTTAFFESGGLRFPVAELASVERVESGGLLQSRLFELWAWFRGEQVRLFQCYSSREFGQVCRALTRAREYAGLM
jgi:Family of unknown function (DUF6232)